MEDNSVENKTPEKRSYNLIVYIMVLALLFAAGGYFVKYAVGDASPELQDIPAVAVPFAVLHDKTLLGPEGSIRLPWRQDEISEETETSFETEAETLMPARTTDPYLSFHDVDESYFSDALFIGDSRTDGLRLYARIPGADYFCTTGMTSFNAFERTASDIHEDLDTDETAGTTEMIETVETIGAAETIETAESAVAASGSFEDVDLETLLSARQYGKVYIMLGINEMGSNLERVCGQLTTVVNRVRELQPNAYVILMANLVVTREMAASRASMSLDRFEVVNGHMASLADQRRVFYINANPLFIDESGYLRSDLTGDGCHLYAVNYAQWVEFIMHNGVG